MTQAMTQTEMVVDLLRRRGEEGLTPLDALNVVGSFRLSARIYDAKQIIDPEEEIVTTYVKVGPDDKVVAKYILRRRSPGTRQSTLW